MMLRSLLKVLACQVGAAQVGLVVLVVMGWRALGLSALTERVAPMGLGDRA